jgi:hypothetical protein
MVMGIFEMWSDAFVQDAIGACDGRVLHFDLPGT